MNRNTTGRRRCIAAATFATVMMIGTGCGDQTGTGQDQQVGFQPASDTRNGPHAAAIRPPHVQVHKDTSNAGIAEYQEQQRSHQSAPSSSASGDRAPDSRP